jgi:hypothetical protein
MIAPANIIVFAGLCRIRIHDAREPLDARVIFSPMTGQQSATAGIQVDAGVP